MDMNYLVIIFIGFFCVIGLIVAIWLFFFRGANKKEFLYYSPDTLNIKTIKAQLKIDPTNSAKRIFFFSNGTNLTVREPTAYFNGKAYREITQDANGEFVYISRKFDKEKYLQLALMPEEKSISLNRYKENQKSYDTGTTKLQAAMLIGLFILVIINVFATIYITTQAYGRIDDINEIAKETSKTTTSMAESSSIMIDVTELQAQITAALTKDVNLTRRLS